MDTKWREELQRVKNAHRELPDIQVSNLYEGLRVIGLVADNSACGYYRIILPLHMLKMHGAQVCYTSFHSGNIFKDYDTILAPRQHNGEVLDIYRHAGWEGKNLIYEIDDDLHHVSPSNPAFGVYHQGTQECRSIPEFLKSSHGWTTTTPELARLYYRYNQNPVIIENFIDFSIRDWGADVSWDNGNPVITPKEIKKPEEWKDKVVLAWSGGTCVDDQTEILTDKGFKYFKDLEKGVDKVATLNPNTQEIEFHVPTNYIENQYTGLMHQVENKHINYCVTPNHQMWVAKRSGGIKEDLVYSKELSSDIVGKNRYFAKSGKWAQPDLETIQIGNTTFQVDDWLKIFGFWLADGWVAGSRTKNPDPSAKQVGFCQYKNPSILHELQEIINSYGYHAFISKNNTRLLLTSPDMWEYLSRIGGAADKHIPRMILDNCSTRQLKLLLEYYLLGDGSAEKGPGCEKYRLRSWTCSKGLADNLVELALKINWAANVKVKPPKNGIINGRILKANHPSYCVSYLQNEGKYTYLKPHVKGESHQLVEYSGSVHCVTVKNHLIYIRRKGVCHWTGNSHKEDLEQVGPAIKTILSRNEDVIFAFYGSWDMYQWILKTFNIPENRTSYIKARHFMDYPAGLHGFDISLAPITCDQFNLCKSFLRIEEYLSVGSACIASNVGPYARFETRHPGSVLLVGNSPHAFPSWTEAIQYLVDNPEKRKQMQEQGRKIIIEYYSLEKNFHRWPQAWAAIAERREKGILGPDPENKPAEWYLSYGKNNRNDMCPCGSNKKYKDCHRNAWG